MWCPFWLVFGSFQSSAVFSNGPRTPTDATKLENTKLPPKKNYHQNYFSVPAHQPSKNHPVSSRRLVCGGKSICTAIWAAHWNAIGIALQKINPFTMLNTTKRITLLFIVQLLLHCDSHNIWIEAIHIAIQIDS